MTTPTVEGFFLGNTYEDDNGVTRRANDFAVDRGQPTGHLRDRRRPHRGAPQMTGLFEPEHPCREMPTRHCPVVYQSTCGDRPCARFESDDEAPWLPEMGEYADDH